MLPLIGISCCIDAGGADGLLPPRRLYYVARDYAEAVERAGAVPVMVPFLTEREPFAALLRTVHGLVVSGGGRRPQSSPLPGLRDQHPERYEADTRLLRRALELGLPVLGICRGHQMLNEVLGGSLVEVEGHHQVPVPAHEPAHSLRVAAGSGLARSMGGTEFRVNSLHRQAVTTAGTGLVAVAWSGEGSVEAVEGTGPGLLLGVQFHPEFMPAAPWSRGLFAALVAAAAEYARLGPGRPPAPGARGQ